MKRILLSITSATIALLIIPAAAYAAPKTHTTVSGQVTNTSDHGIGGANVTIVCGSTTKHATTTPSGFYSKNFTNKQCPDGSTATVTASKGSASGSSSGTVENSSKHLNIAVVDVTLPEFGLVTAAGATTLGGAAFLAVRRRQTSGHQA